MLVEAGLCLVALLVVWVSHFAYRWSNPKCNGKLPPGSMGLPLIGDTFEFFASHSLYELSPFMSKKIALYGPLFRAGLLGQRMVVSTDPETNFSMFKQENPDLLLWYGGSFEEMIGDEKLLASHGSIHKYMKNLILSFVGPESLRTKLLHQMDVATQRHLHSWATDGCVDVKDASPEMLFEFVAGKLLSYDEAKQSKKLGENFKTFKDGLTSFPLNIPGTTFHGCIQAHKRAMKAIEEIYLERKASKIPGNDFLDNIIAETTKKDTFLNDTNVTKLLFAILLAGYESTSQAVTLVTKLVADHPDVLAELMKEHEAILNNRENKNSGITWEEYKSMTFTHMVINETVRLGNMVPGIFRKAMKDVEINGYTIPKGWILMAALPVVHLSPDKYESPFVFNPWRWQGKELNAGSKSFMGFGIGARLCVGAEFTKVQLAVYLHHLVANYRWSVYKGGEIIRRPVNIFPNGLHIKIAEK